MSADEVNRKPYQSPLRAAAARETRRRIRAAAAELFTSEGYAATTMTAVAAAAGVSDRTVYLSFETKAALLNECIRVAVRGGDEEAPLMARAGFRSVLEAPPERMLARLADASAQLMRRAARLLAVGESAWNQDPLLREFRERGHAATRADALDIAKALRRARVLRTGMSPQRAADVIYALTASESVYLRLVDDQDWSDSAYARMLERALVGALRD
ncbi:MAG: TetR family transcriptional regulator [Solirubrobacteraceae bacterium]|jgi:AcrR family transcriptional regulator